ncbi:hypothetical protein BV25DRAFT_1325743 [Artomyces pyxidatus]|uniref:Uncharacterized protein n=1 Tax=Artomyces pyxidatus TaxID=48021 RepID=A0ACB8SNR3_9AGAM|nr:hypothetical protein BV25DRAFT_1325743 [Artomyces pyxidatus]
MDRHLTSGDTSQSNDPTPIARLPPEVLARVFSFNVLIEPPSPRPFPPRPSLPSTTRITGLGWINLTHVCRFWRQVALGEPTLWADLNVDLGPKWTAVMLERSKSVPISVSRGVFSEVTTLGGTPQDWRLESIIEVVSKHHSHLGQLQLTGDSNIVPVVAKLLSSSTPVLQSLDLQINTEWDDVRNTIPTPPFESVVTSAPQLRFIVMTRCQPSWAYPLPYPLTHLEIRLPTAAMRLGVGDPGVTAVSPLAFDNIVASLRNMPGLKTLILEHCLPSRPSVPPDSSSQLVALPELATLVLGGKTVDCFNIVQSIQIPPTTKVALSMACMVSGGRGEECEIVLPFIKAHLAKRDADAPPLRTLNISDSAGIGLFIQGWTISTPEPNFQPYHLTPLIHLLFGFDSEGDGTNLDVVRNVCNALPLEGLETLSLDVQDFQDQWSPQTWVEDFARYKKVRSLHAASAAATPLCIALSLDLPTSQESSPIEFDAQSVLFPRLKQLSLAGATLDEANAREFGVGLKTRRAFAIGLEWLLAGNCDIDVASIPLIRDSVVQMEVASDGSEYDLEEYDE